jgi:hypothetical protein
LADEARKARDEDVGHQPGVVSSGGGYRAIFTVGDRRVWSCPHVHFTEHSARACADRHFRKVAPAATASGTSPDERA